MSGVNVGPSRYYVSLDRGRSWSPPYRLPLFGQLGIAARTDYLVSGPRDCFLFLTASKSNGHEGRPLCVRTTDGGMSWKRVSWIGPEPSGLGDFSIMPSTIRWDDMVLLTSFRTHKGSQRWIDIYRSLDNGESWQYDGKGAENTGTGNPPSMIQLADGRICLTYGYRAKPYGIRARTSSDQGNTWARGKKSFFVTMAPALTLATRAVCSAPMAWWSQSTIFRIIMIRTGTLPLLSGNHERFGWCLS